LLLLVVMLIHTGGGSVGGDGGGGGGAGDVGGDGGGGVSETTKFVDDKVKRYLFTWHVDCGNDPRGVKGAVHASKQKRRKEAVARSVQPVPVHNEPQQWTANTK
jgi:hypothetical protein